MTGDKNQSIQHLKEKNNLICFLLTLRRSSLFSIDSRHDLRIEVCHRNQLNMNKLSLYKLLLSFYKVSHT